MNRMLSILVILTLGFDKKASAYFIEYFIADAKNSLAAK